MEVGVMDVILVTGHKQLDCLLTTQLGLQAAIGVVHQQLGNGGGHVLNNHMVCFACMCNAQLEVAVHVAKSCQGILDHGCSLRLLPAGAKQSFLAQHHTQDLANYMFY